MSISACPSLRSIRGSSLWRWPLGAIVLGLALIGCATNPPAVPAADQYFAERDFGRAARAYENLLALPPAEVTARDRVMFRLALSYSSQSEAPDLRRTARLFEALIEAYPDSEYVPAAQLMLELWDDLSSLRGEVAERTRLIEQLIAGSRTLQGSLADLEARKSREVGLLDRQLAELSRQYRDRTAEVADLEQQLEQLRDELEELKRIDTKLSKPLN